MQKNILLAFAVILCQVLLLIPSRGIAEPQQSVAEWQQTDCDSSHTRCLNSRIEPPLKVSWSVKTDADVGPLVAYGNAVYVLSARSISAVCCSDGATRWTRELGLPLGEMFAPSARLVPSIATRQYIILSDGQSVYLMRATDGKLLRKEKVDDGANHQNRTALMGWSRGSCVMQTNRTDGLGALEVLNPEGKTIEVVMGTPKKSFESAICIGAIGPTYDWIYLQTPHELLNFQGLRGKSHRSLYLISQAEVVADSNSVYVYDVKRMTRLARDLSPIWSVDVPWGDYPILVSSSLLLIYDWQRIRALDKRTGRLMWSLNVPERRPNAIYSHFVPPVLVGNNLYLAVPSLQSIISGRRPIFSKINTLTCVDIRTGMVRWSQRVATDIKGMIAHRTSLYILDQTDEHTSSKKPAAPIVTRQRLVRLDSARLTIGSRK